MQPNLLLPSIEFQQECYFFVKESTRSQGFTLRIKQKHEEISLQLSEFSFLLQSGSYLGHHLS